MQEQIRYATRSFLCLRDKRSQQGRYQQRSAYLKKAYTITSCMSKRVSIRASIIWLSARLNAESAGLYLNTVTNLKNRASALFAVANPSAPLFFLLRKIDYCGRLSWSREPLLIRIGYHERDYRKDFENYPGLYNLYWSNYRDSASRTMVIFIGNACTTCSVVKRR